MSNDYSPDEIDNSDISCFIEKNSAGASQPESEDDSDIPLDTASEQEEAGELNEIGESGNENNKAKMEFYDWIQCFVSAIICGIFIFVFIGKSIGVDGESMLGTLHNNDRVVMSGLFYTPKNGDIIIFNPPTDEFGSTPLVKRVIAMENQTIDIDFDSGEVFVDGKMIDKSDSRYVSEGTFRRSNFVGPYTVPEGHVFVMGDNRNHSSDSRDARIGAVDTRYILGRVLFLLIPGGDEENQREWRRFGFVS